MVQFEELRLELERTKPEIDDLADALGLKAMESEIQQLENRATEPGFWDDMEKAQKVTLDGMGDFLLYRMGNENELCYFDICQVL